MHTSQVDTQANAQSIDSCAKTAVNNVAGGEKAQIGIVHNLMPFEARKGRYGLFVWWTRVLAKVCNVCWGNDIILDYLGTGQLNWAPLAPIPLGATSYTDPQGRPPMDWIGLNFYSRCPLRHPGPLF